MSTVRQLTPTANNKVTRVEVASIQSVQWQLTATEEQAFQNISQFLKDLEMDETLGMWPFKKFEVLEEDRLVAENLAQNLVLFFEQWQEFFSLLTGAMAEVERKFNEGKLLMQKASSSGAMLSNRVQHVIKLVKYNKLFKAMMSMGIGNYHTDKLRDYLMKLDELNQTSMLMTASVEVESDATKSVDELALITITRRLNLQENEVEPARKMYKHVMRVAQTYREAIGDLEQTVYGIDTMMKELVVTMNNTIAAFEAVPDYIKKGVKANHYAKVFDAILKIKGDRLSFQLLNTIQKAVKRLESKNPFIEKKRIRRGFWRKLFPFLN